MRLALACLSIFIALPLSANPPAAPPATSRKAPVLLPPPPVALQSTSPSQLPEAVVAPEWAGRSHVLQSDWPRLDALVEKLAASGERAEDGRFHLFLLTFKLESWLEENGSEMDRVYETRFKEYREQFPGSAFAPILAAMQVHATAWRARGRGFSSTVTPEGRALFKERAHAAWDMMQQVKARSSRLPTWYEQAINIGMDADVEDTEITALFNEGINRFPGYHGLYFKYLRQFSPRWGGSYEAADAFIKTQVSARTNPEGEILYARLYWGIDKYGGSDPNFFEESLVSWPRMRKGFELLMQKFPKGTWNQANLLSYACRAQDEATYANWRFTVDRSEFMRAPPQGVSLEVCDARFTQQT